MRVGPGRVAVEKSCASAERVRACSWLVERLVDQVVSGCVSGVFGYINPCNLFG